MLSSPLHICVHCISRITDPSSCLQTCTLWRPRWNVHWYRQSFDRFVFCCIICSQIKKIRVLVAKPELLISCHPNERQSAVFSPEDHRDTTPWLENRWLRLSALMKNRGVGGTCKIRAVWIVWKGLYRLIVLQFVTLNSWCKKQNTDWTCSFIECHFPNSQNSSCKP